MPAIVHLIPNPEVTIFAEAAFWISAGLILYTYCLFPLILAAVARIAVRTTKATPEPADDLLPTVTMIIAAYNEAAVLPGKIANTLKIDYPRDRFRVLIGSDGSSDGTDKILRQAHEDTSPELLRLDYRAFASRRGKISVLNDLVAQTDSDILVMSDANTVYSPDAVRNLVRHFTDPNIGCVSGVLSLEQNGGVSGEGLYWKYEQWIKRSESALGFLIGCNGGIFAIRRELYEPLPSTTIIEDFVLTLRVVERGFRVLLEPAAKATEPPCSSSRAEMVRKIRIGAGGWQALGLCPALLRPSFGLRSLAFWGHKVLRWLVPCFLLVALVANLALCHLPIYACMLALWLGGFGLALAAYRARPMMPLPKWTRPMSYFFLMNYSLLCGLIRFLLKRQRVTWERSTENQLTIPQTELRTT